MRKTIQSRERKEKDPLGGTRREKMHGQQYTQQFKMTKNGKKLTPYVAQARESGPSAVSGRADKKEVRLEIDPRRLV